MRKIKHVAIGSVTLLLAAASPVMADVGDVDITKVDADVKKTDISESFNKDIDVDVRKTDIDVKKTDIDVKKTDVDVKKTDISESFNKDIDVKKTDISDSFNKDVDVDVKKTDIDVKKTDIDVKKTDISDSFNDIKIVDIDLQKNVFADPIAANKLDATVTNNAVAIGGNGFQMQMATQMNGGSISDNAFQNFRGINTGGNVNTGNNTVVQSGVSISAVVVSPL